MRKRLLQELRARTSVPDEIWQAAVSRADGSGSSLSAQLVGLGVDAHELLDALCVTSSLPPAPADRVRAPSVPAMQGFEPTLCWRALILPFAITRGQLHVAFADPETAQEAETLGLPFHVPYLAAPDDILAGLKVLFKERPVADTAYLPVATQAPRPITIEAMTVENAPAPMHSEPTVPEGFAADLPTTIPGGGYQSLPPAHPTEPELAAAETIPRATVEEPTVEDASSRGLTPVVPMATVKERARRSSGHDELAGYRVIRRLGGGGMADIYEAEPPDGGEPVALKVIQPHLAKNEVFLERFHREAKACLSLRHDNVVRVLAQGEHEGTHFMAVELVRGGTVAQLLRRTGNMPAQLAARIVDDVLDGLAHAHAMGVVHRDIKPDNLLIDHAGRVKIADFGIAKQTGDATLTRTGFLIGTPAYVSPEQAMGDDVDGRSDLFSLGVVLYELLTGTNPFFSESASATLLKISEVDCPPIYFVDDTLPGVLERLVDGLLQANPDRRFPSAAVAREALAPLVAGYGPSVVEKSLVEPEATCQELRHEQAVAEAERAAELMRLSPPNVPAAAVALYRAGRLEPSLPMVQARYELLRRDHKLKSDPPDNPKWGETLAALEDNPHAPGLLKRAAELARAHRNFPLYARYLRRYAELRPTDSLAATELARVLGETSLEAPTPFAAGSTYSASRVGQDTRALIEGIKTGGFKSQGPVRPQPAPAPNEAASSASPPVVVGVLSAGTVEPKPSALDYARAVWRGYSTHLVIAGLVVGLVVGSLNLLGGFIESEQTKLDVKIRAGEDKQKQAVDTQTAMFDREQLKSGERLLAGGDARAARVVATEVVAHDADAELVSRALVLRARSSLALKLVPSARSDLETVMSRSETSAQTRREAQELLDELE